MSYTVLARRYRSQDFDEVIGQEPIARTLQRAIETGRTAHAYLFTGTRGVGKTSMARIFARALNVSDHLAERDAIAAAIMRGDDIDVIEIDGASNRGIDEARDLIANCIYRPTRCPYKIYIIDEVHMLTTPAFNALLKTMEEPPEHVKFILCTTEPHKVPTTIQSRCQRFDFRAIPTARIAAHLRDVLKREKVKAEESVVLQVARLGNGSMRDALSILDRLLSTGESPITAQTLQEMLGLPDTAIIADLVEAIADAEPARALDLTNELLGRGISIDQLLEVLIERLRTLMLMATCGPESALVELSDAERETAAAQAERFDPPALVHMIALLENVQRAAKSSPTARALLDAAVVRLALSEKFADAARLLADGSTRDGAAPPAATAPAQKKSPAPRRPVTAAPDPVAPSPPHPVAPSDPWQRVLDHAASRPQLASIFENAEFVGSLDNPAIHLRLSREMLAFARMRAAEVARTIGEALGRSVTVEFSAAESDEPASTATTSSAFEEAANIPIVRKAMELLDARIVHVEEQRMGDDR